MMPEAGRQSAETFCGAPLRVLEAEGDWVSMFPLNNFVSREASI